MCTSVACQMHDALLSCAQVREVFWSVPHSLEVIGKRRGADKGARLGYITSKLFTVKTEQVGITLSLDYALFWIKPCVASRNPNLQIRLSCRRFAKQHRTSSLLSFFLIKVETAHAGMVGQGWHVYRRES